MKYASGLIFTLGFFIAGCVGMSESECLHANWELIGLEDGTQGRNLSYANTHQRDCSKHGSQLDMEAYRVGHAEGLKTYCRADNGFTIGKSGRVYSGICPEDLEEAFLKNHEIGREFYLLEKDVSDTSSAIRNHLSYIEELNQKIDKKADQAVELDISRQERDRIQDEMRDLQFEILDIERLVGNLQLELEFKEAELAELRRYYNR